MARIIRRAAQLEREDPNGDAASWDSPSRSVNIVNAKKLSQLSQGWLNAPRICAAAALEQFLGLRAPVLAEVLVEQVGQARRAVAEQALLLGEVAGAIVQNHGKLSRWAAALDAGELATARGVVRDADDELRAAIIGDLMCRHYVDKRVIEARFEIADFDRKFATELRELHDFIGDGLVVDERERLSLTEEGELFVRNVAMLFDARLCGERGAAARRFSATV